MTALTETGFVLTSRQIWPYQMVHTDACASAKRSKWGSKATFEQVAAAQASQYGSLPEMHEQCIKRDLADAIRKRAGAIRSARVEDEHRRKLAVELSILEVAVELIQGELGTLTDEEQGFHRERKKQLRSGQFRPRSDGFRPAEYVVSQAPPLEDAYGKS